ncbi:Sorting nexin, cytoplasm-to-vacuole targeting pathway/endosomal sorting [Rhodotorula sphaerocarpa]
MSSPNGTAPASPALSSDSGPSPGLMSTPVPPAESGGSPRASHDDGENDDHGGSGSAAAAYPFSADPYPQDEEAIKRHQARSAEREAEYSERQRAERGEDQSAWAHGQDGGSGGTHSDNAADRQQQPQQPQASQQPRQQRVYVRPARDAIQIVDALKTSEGASTPYIVYCIRFENRDVRRRYSDFVSLRQALATLHPCFIVPPLPPKNTLSSYAVSATNPAKAKEDAALIARRRRMLATFLNRTLIHPTLGQDRVFRRFLDPETPWHDVLHSPPVTLAPKNPLRAPAHDPTDPDLLALFASLPLPSSSATLTHPDQRFLDSEVFTNKFSAHLGGSMEKVNRRLMKRWHDAAGDWGEMGGGLNGFALRMGEDGSAGLDEATEKVGMAVDSGYTLTNAMLSSWEQDFTEPLQEYTQFSNIIKGLLKYRHSKHLQYEAARELLESKRATLEELERSELEAQRLEKALERVRIVNDDGNSDRAVSPPQGQTTSPGLIGSAAEGGGGATSQQQQQQAPLPSLPSSSGALPSPPLARRGGGLVSALRHSVKGLVDADPEATRRSSIGKTREQINQLDEAIKALTSDLRYASTTIQGDLDRFQRQKNLAMWEEAKAAIDAIAD